MNAAYRGIVAFDVDDTLIKRHEVWHRLWNVAATSVGLQHTDYHTFIEGCKRHVPRDRLLETLYPDVANLEGGVGRLVQEYRDMFGGFVYPIVEGAPEVIVRVKGQGFMVGILSSTTSSDLGDTLRRHGFDTDNLSFTFVGKDIFVNGVQTKADPRIFDKVVEIADREGIRLRAYVDNSPITYKPSKERGFHYVGVRTGPETMEEFLEAGVNPENVLPSVAELPEYLERLVIRTM